MSEEKIREKPPVPPIQEKAKEPSAPKTSQSAFDKVLEQQKILQQSPVLQSKFTEQSSTDQRVKEAGKWKEGHEDRGKRDDKDEGNFKDRLKSKEKSDLTVTRDAVGKAGERQGGGGGSGGSGGKEGRGGSGSELMKRQIAQKKISDLRGMLTDLSKSHFAGKLAEASSAKLNITPQQIQSLVNKVVQSIKVGKNELGWPELKIILKESIFNGLNLRFTSKNGKVTVEFSTKDAKVAALFKSQASKIKAALEEKGVKVEEIKVS